MEIDVFSDPICPWCFIGKKRLNTALAMRPETDVVIRWRAFQLNPEMPTDGMGRRAYLETKFGGQENASRIYGNIAAVGETVGIDFQFDRIETTPNTLKAHRLTRLLQSKNSDDAERFVDRLFEAYFLEGRNIGDPEILADIVRDVGLQAENIPDFLAGNDFEQEIMDEDVMARRIGINGVPCFIIDGQYALSGAQEPEAFMPLFDLAASGGDDNSALRG